MAQLFDTARIANDPELRHTAGQNPQAVIELSLPCEYGRKDPNTGKRNTQWVQATLWGKQAEALSPYLLKGQWVQVTLDDVHNEEFQRRDGSSGTKLVGRISNIKLVGSAPQQQGQQQQQRQPAPPPRQQQPQHNDFDDESIPF